MTNAAYLQLLTREQENLNANLKTLFTLGETTALDHAIPYYYALTDFKNRLEDAIVDGTVSKNAEVVHLFTFTPKAD